MVEINAVCESYLNKGISYVALITSRNNIRDILTKICSNQAVNRLMMTMPRYFRTLPKSPKIATFGLKLNRDSIKLHSMRLCFNDMLLVSIFFRLTFMQYPFDRKVSHARSKPIVFPVNNQKFGL